MRFLVYVDYANRWGTIHRPECRRSRGHIEGTNKARSAKRPLWLGPFDTADPEAPRLALYHWLSWLQEEVVQAMSRSLET